MLWDEPSQLTVDGLGVELSDVDSDNVTDVAPLSIVHVTGWVTNRRYEAYIDQFSVDNVPPDQLLDNVPNVCAR